jgi:hypothetical protein
MMLLRYLLATTILVGILLPTCGSAAFSPADRRCISCHEDVAEHIQNSQAIHADAGVSCVSCHRDDFARRAPHRGEPEPASCGQCHEAANERHQLGPHAGGEAVGHAGASCADCHGSHDILPATDPRSKVYHLNVTTTCSQCHTGSEDFDPQSHVEHLSRWVAGAYADGIHGRLLQKGLRVAPSCVTCHGVHAVRPAQDPDSLIAPENVANMCGNCHEGTKNAFLRGRHGTHRQNGGTATPGCVDCHSPHLTVVTGTPEWKLQGIQECGTCHEKETLTYRDTFHGKVTSLGFVRVAACADCHGAHEVLPKSDPRSPIAPDNLMKTCGSCHSRLNENYVRYNPHADHRDRDGEPLLYWSTVFMHGLLIGVFGIFGLHTLLWAWRGWRNAFAWRFVRRSRSNDDSHLD